MDRATPVSTEAISALERPRPALKRSVGLLLAVLYGLGVTIGAGIYVLIGAAAGRAHFDAALHPHRLGGVDGRAASRARGLTDTVVTCIPACDRSPTARRDRHCYHRCEPACNFDPYLG